MVVPFDRVAWGYGQFMRFWGLFRETEVLGLLDPRAQDRIVDLGGGTGQYARLIAPRCQEVVVVDESRKMLARVPRLPGLRTLQADVLATGLAQGWADGALLCDVVHHAADQRALFIEARRLVRSGGRLVLLDFDRDHFLTRILEIFEQVFLPPVSFRTRKELEALAKEAGWVFDRGLTGGALIIGLWRAR